MNNMQCSGWEHITLQVLPTNGKYKWHVKNDTFCLKFVADNIKKCFKC